MATIQRKVKLIRAVTVAQSIGFYLPIVNKLQNYGYEIVSVSNSGPELIELHKLGVKTIEVSMERRMSPLKDIVSLIQLIKVFKKEHPYIVHSMTPKAGLLCMLAAWITRVPRRVHTFTGLVWPTASGVSRKILMFTDWLTCACATHIIPEGRGVMADLRSLTNKPMQVLGYGNVKGVDMQKFSRRKEVLEMSKSIRHADSFTFIFVGRLVRDKGINELVSAFDKLSKKYSGVRLLLVGNREDKLDPLMPVTEETIRNNPKIKAIGPKYGDELLAYYVASDCFVFPSYREGFPNVVLEAGAMGLPCIVTDINGSREIIEHGKNGWVIPSKDESALYESMQNVLLNHQEAKLLALNSRKMIESRFEQSFVQQCLCDFYKEIM